ncbi:flagellar basal body P-ring formation chaperone FlgA [Terrarubrum flagellatum]|uniref:flagellar basal body P-ring formation chaperone FlgA n=1 Tax=Terrirubrum flagellatum TaxID=2895980 RepID=UPI003144FBEE
MSYIGSVSLKTVGLAVFFTAAFVAASSADAQQPAAGDASASTPVMRREAIVDGDIVTLGDLVEKCGRLCSAPMFQAPAPGQTGTIQTMRFVAAARDAGLAFVETNGVAQIKVMRTGRAATREDIDAALALAIAARTSIDPGDISLTLDQPYVKLSLAANGKDNPSVTDLVIDTRNRRFSASLVTPQTRGAVAARVSGYYVETLAVPILTRAVQRGDVVRAEDISIERRDRDTFGDETPLTPSLVAGRVARSALRSGIVLRDRDLVKPLLVDRGAPVTMTLDSGALQLTLKGKAVDQGSLGDLVGVQNLNSKRVVQGIVTGAGTVRVDPGAAALTARTAAAQ